MVLEKEKIKLVKTAYTASKNLRPATRELLENITKIVDEYVDDGYRLTLRQLYYQLVSQNTIPNENSEYPKLSTILKDARMCGKIDWDVIEDRVRIPQMPSEWKNIPDLVNSAVYSYRKNRMHGQTNYVEVWVEKDALSGVLLPITQEYHVNLMVNRGYSSVSAMHDASLRFQEAINNNKKCTILYLGDHDPSGLDMIRDVYDRLSSFNVYVDVKPIALTQQQIKKYNPPPNPTKITDPRAVDYIAQYGKTSWELDALKPKVLNKLLRTNIKKLINMNKYNSIIMEEEQEKVKLIELLDKF